MMTVHKEGYKTIAIGTIIFGLINFLILSIYQFTTSLAKLAAVYCQFCTSLIPRFSFFSHSLAETDPGR